MMSPSPLQLPSPLLLSPPEQPPDPAPGAPGAHDEVSDMFLDVLVPDDGDGEVYAPPAGGGARREG